MNTTPRNTPRESSSSEDTAPERAKDVMGDQDQVVDEKLSILEEIVERTQNIMEYLKKSLAEIMKDIPIINEIFADFIDNELTPENIEEVDGLSPDEFDERFLANIELSDTQRNIYSWSRESINFWNNNLLTDVPALPPRAVGWLFGIFESESSFRVDAANPNSSARGLGQFVNRTWANYIRLFGDELTNNGKPFTEEELNNPDARTDNPRLMVYMTTAYLMRSYQVLSRNNLVPNGWQTADIEFMLYILHHHGEGDGPRYLRYYNAQPGSRERENIRASMRHEHLLDWNPTDSYGRITANRMQNWVRRFTNDNDSEVT